MLLCVRVRVWCVFLYSDDDDDDFYDFITNITILRTIPLPTALLLPLLLPSSSTFLLYLDRKYLAPLELHKHADLNDTRQRPPTGELAQVEQFPSLAGFRPYPQRQCH